MIPFYLDINTSHDASTTLNRKQTEFRIQEVPTTYKQDLVNLEEFMNGDLISVFTNVSLSNQQPLEHINESSSFEDDFDLISKFEFKSSKRIKARIKKSEYSPSIIID